MLVLAALTAPAAAQEGGGGGSIDVSMPQAALILSHPARPYVWVDDAQGPAVVRLQRRGPHGFVTVRVRRSPHSGTIRVGSRLAAGTWRAVVLTHRQGRLVSPPVVSYPAA